MADDMRHSKMINIIYETAPVDSTLKVGSLKDGSSLSSTKTIPTSLAKFVR